MALTAALFGVPQQLSAQRRRARGDLPALIHELGLEQAVLNQPWAELSVRPGPLFPALHLARAVFVKWQPVMFWLHKYFSL